MMPKTHLALLILFACLAGACVPEPDAVSDTTDRPREEPSLRPNFLLIVADDMGYTDLGAFGGEINTQNLDALAARSVRLTNFHAAPTCAPTRAMLLSGTDNHTAGLGSMFGSNMLSGIERRSGYEGYLHERVATLPERLGVAGYHTYMAGKWHLGSEANQWPSARGFERSFALLPGSGDHFSPAAGDYEEDGAPLDTLPDDFYSTHTYTDKLISYIANNHADGRPFFAYAAYTSPHWPLQTPEDFIDRYAGQYAEGFEAVRSRRISRARELGVLPRLDAPLPEWVGPTWNELDPAAQAAYARKMEIYAAMVENLDYNVGRLIAHLEETNLLDNTIILFMSDNGAESDEMELNPTFAARIRRNGSDNSLENLGRRGSWASYGAGWAQVAMASYGRFKGFSTEGGTRVPAFVLRGSAESIRGIDNQYLRVTDVAPTILEMAGLAASSETFRGRQVAPMEGRSFAGILRGDDTPIYGPEEPISSELHGHRSIQRGSFKLVWEQAPGNTWWGYPIPEAWGRWQLYRLDQDPGETRDLSLEQPEVTAELAALWNNFARDHNVATDVSIINFERWHPDGAAN